MYDRTKTHGLLMVARAHKDGPFGAVLSEMATQLIDAEAEVAATVKSQADVRGEADEANRRLMTEAQAHRTTKELAEKRAQDLMDNLTVATTALTAIAADSRGAKKLAQDALYQINPPLPATPAV